MILTFPLAHELRLGRGITLRPGRFVRIEIDRFSDSHLTKPHQRVLLLVGPHPIPIPRYYLDERKPKLALSCVP
jgi:hypothetical protein